MPSRPPLYLQGHWSHQETPRSIIHPSLDILATTPPRARLLTSLLDLQFPLYPSLRHPPEPPSLPLTISATPAPTDSLASVSHQQLTKII